MQQIELSGEGLLDEVVDCVDVRLYFLASLMKLVDFIQTFLFACHSHLQPVVLFLQLHLARWQISPLHPHLVIQVHLYPLLLLSSLLFLTHPQNSMPVR
jgi:hypothetical protein